MKKNRNKKLMKKSQITKSREKNAFSLTDYLTNYNTSLAFSYLYLDHLSYDRIIFALFSVETRKR